MECLRLEYVTVCVGFDDMLVHTLEQNMSQVDTAIVVTDHNDRKTHEVCRKLGVRCVPTDLFKKNGRNFNKGAAINAGFNYFQYHGWRMHLDSDIMLPPMFRTMLFNHEYLAKNTIYGCDRVNVYGKKELETIWNDPLQRMNGLFVGQHGKFRRQIEARFVNNLEGYLPLGYFQLWNACTQKPYPYSLGSAAHDDTMFSGLWPRQSRDLLKTSYVYHLAARETKMGENWEGHRKQPRFE